MLLFNKIEKFRANGSEFHLTSYLFPLTPYLTKKTAEAVFLLFCYVLSKTVDRLVDISDLSVEELGVSLLERCPGRALVVVHCATEEAVGEVVELGGEKSAKVDDNGLADEVEHEGVITLVSVSELHSLL